MRWIKPTLTSLYGVLGKASPKADHATDLRFENVRKAMLELMTRSGCDEDFPLVVRKIFYADNIEALWYARSDMLKALSAERDQFFAQREIATISKLFEGLLPAGLVERRVRRRSR
jgi:hypothetical protein